MKPATQIYVEYRFAVRRLAAGAVMAVLAACSGSDYAGAPAPQPTVVRADPAAPRPAPAAHTGEDGYPNINVDTAAPSRAPTRTVEERDRLESELMALGARQRSTAAGPAPQSVIQELEDLGRRSKADAERQIESGQSPQ